MVWREDHGGGPVPPEPWPGRYEAFMAACALHAGQRERDLLEVVQAIGSGSDAPPAPDGKPMNPLRLGQGD